MDYSELSDNEIVEKTLSEKEAFRVLVERYELPLDRYLIRLGIRNKEDRVDLLQDIFIKIYRNLNGFDMDLSFSSWAYRIAHNEAVSWFRKRSVRPEGHMVNDGEELLVGFKTSDEDGADMEFDKKLQGEDVLSALDG